MGSLNAGPHTRHSVTFDEDVGAVRRAVGRAAAVAPNVKAGDVELVVTELASNIVRHAPAGGYVLFRQVGGGVELLAVDRGASTDADPPLTPRSVAPWSLATSRGLGAGLAAVARLSDDFDLYSATGGTVVLARLGVGERFEDEWCVWGAVNVPRRGETESGDAWTVVPVTATTTVALLVDGLGHGIHAAAASAAAVDALGDRPTADPAVLVERFHEAMRPTRGGVVAAAIIDRVRDELLFVGLGNVAACVVTEGASRYLPSRDGMLGGQAITPPRPLPVPTRWAPADVLVLASDGVRTRWDLGSYPGLLDHDPAVVAATVQRDHERGTDDSAVLVLRDLREQP